jgi:hypothetical protein
VESTLSIIAFGLLCLLLGVGCLASAYIIFFTPKSKSDPGGLWFWRIVFGLPIGALGCALLLAFILAAHEIVQRLTK